MEYHGYMLVPPGTYYSISELGVGVLTFFKDD